MSGTYEVRVGDEVRIVFQADLQHASAPIWLVVGGKLESTPFQTADARHRENWAADLLVNWSECHGQVGRDETYTVVRVR